MSTRGDAVRSETELVLRAIEQQGTATIEAIERSQAAQRDGFRTLSESLNRLGEAILRQIEQTAKLEASRTTADRVASAVAATPRERERETNWGWFFGIGGLLAAMIVPLYGWQGDLADSTAQTLSVIDSRIDTLRAAISKVDREQAALLRDQREIETQFDAMWMALDTELQHQDRINGLLWNGNPVNKDNPWIERDYWPSMRRKEIGQ